MGRHAIDFAEMPITMGQAKILYVVLAAGELRMSEVAASLGVGSSAASESVDRLVDLGLLRRRDEPGDRRQVVVAATPTGEALLERFRELNAHQLREMLGRLDADELDVIARSIEIFGRALDRASESTATSTTTSATTTGEKRT